MSDLYLVLRHRLEAVPEWVYIDSAVLMEARHAQGLSYESLARQLHVSSKTWERYEKAGRIPRPLLTRVAHFLQLEVEEPEPRRVTLAVEDEPALLAALTALDRRLDVDVLPRLDRIEASLRALSRQHERS